MHSLESLLRHGVQILIYCKPLNVMFEVPSFQTHFVSERRGKRRLSRINVFRKSRLILETEARSRDMKFAMAEKVHFQLLRIQLSDRKRIKVDFFLFRVK
ncbi:hypothetical protein CEXT_240511 [Caerostris extrusa]|uniref:Ribosomal protein S10 n=1 Tax=Caerostris extrusa TaxID=172846 RepID=A0AAV4T7Z9_CAEEX|nr:hypothetical protein CEXT_240511 [Caerostris extrusa]